MLFLQFQIGADAYVLDTARIVEVLPLVRIKRIPKAPEGVAGLFNYRGTAVPAVDLSELTLGRAAHRHISTRLILVRYGVHLLGLIAERATETIQREATDFTAAGISSDATPYLGPVTQKAGRLIQRIEVDKLLPESVSRVLFRQAEEQVWSSPESLPS
jgi:chemotaxis-related protein WspB